MHFTECKGRAFSSYWVGKLTKAGTKFLMFYSYLLETCNQICILKSMLVAGVAISTSAFPFFFFFLSSFSFSRLFEMFILKLWFNPNKIMGAVFSAHVRECLAFITWKQDIRQNWTEEVWKAPCVTVITKGSYLFSKIWLSCGSCFKKYWNCKSVGISIPVE